jgi:hypothetical protein
MSILGLKTKKAHQEKRQKMRFHLRLGGENSAVDESNLNLHFNCENKRTPWLFFLFVQWFFCRSDWFVL